MKFNLKLENIKYVKMFCKDSNGDSISIKTGIKSITESQIILLTRYSDSYTSIPPQEIDADIVCDDGIYSIKTRIKKVEKETPYIIYILESVQEMDYKQNREFFRIPYKTECICETNIQGEISHYCGETINISANGMKVVFPNCFITNGVCKISFIIENKKFELQSCYIRSENIDNEYLISFSFTKINDSEREFLLQFCLKKQLEQRRKNLI